MFKAARAPASPSNVWLWAALATFAAALSCSESGAGDDGGSSAGTANAGGNAGSAGHGAAGAAGSSGAAGSQGGSSGSTGSGGSSGASLAGSSGAGSGGTSSGTSGASGTSTAGGSAGVAGSAGESGNTSSGGTAGGGASGSAGSGGMAGSAGGGNGGEAGGGSDYRPCPTDGSACKILPFGDSITDGFGTGGAYRVELFRLAHQAGKNITFVGNGSNGPSMVDGVAFPPNHEGHSGFTIDPTPSRSGISPLVSSVVPQFTPHVITLMIGTNDCIDSYELANAPARLGALLDSIYEILPDVLIVVGQPIPSQDDALNGRLQTYNASIPAVVQARADAGRHIRLTDMYTPFAAVSDYKTSLLKDTWHPNEAGHAILGERWYAALEDML